MFRKLLFSLGLFGMAFFGASLMFAPKTFAALEGDDGPIIYIENNIETETTEPTIVPTDTDEETTPTENLVIATQPDGQDPTVVAETADLITSATISAPSDTNTHEVVFATADVDVNNDCFEANTLETSNDLVPIPELGATLNLVTIDGDGNPVSDVESTTLDKLDTEKEDEWIPQVSISPDGTQILIIRASGDYTAESLYGTKMSMEIVNTADIGKADIMPTTILKAAYDPCLNGGFAQDGGIYYTSCPWFSKNAAIFYLAPGVYDPELAVRIDNKEAEYTFPFFIDVSPDSSTVLIADLTPWCKTNCKYNIDFYKPENKDMDISDCHYYLVDVATGEDENISENFNVFFVPAFFSPDGTKIIGTVYPWENNESFRMTTLSSGVDVNQPYTAVYSILLGTITPLTNQIGVQEWAPKGEVATTTPTTTTTVSTQPTLAYTGSNSHLVLLVSMILLAGSAVLVTKYQLNK